MKPEMSSGPSSSPTRIAPTRARDFARSSTRCSPIPISGCGARAGEPPLPVYEVTFPARRQTAIFTTRRNGPLDSGADLRWGPDRKGVRRIVHPNGVCLIGRWEITEDTGYSGYFAKGSTALAVARYSTCCTETRRGHTRSLSMVGKLFPTTDPEHAAPLRTANFMTQDDIGGDDTDVHQRRRAAQRAGHDAVTARRWARPSSCTSG